MTTTSGYMGSAPAVLNVKGQWPWRAVWLLEARLDQQRSGQILVMIVRDRRASLGTNGFEDAGSARRYPDFGVPLFSRCARGGSG